MDKDTKKNIIAVTIIIVLFLAIITVALMMVKGVDKFSFSLGNGRGQETRKPAEVAQENEDESTASPTDEATKEPTKEPTQEPTKDPFDGKYTFAELDKQMYAKSGVNVRLEPHKDGEKIGHLTTNDKVKVTGQCNETSWYRIEYDNQTAYVSNNYLTDNEVVITQEPTKEPTPEPTKEPTKEPTPEPTVEPTPEPTKEPESTKEAQPQDEQPAQDDTTSEADNDNAGADGQ